MPEKYIPPDKEGTPTLPVKEDWNNNARKSSINVWRSLGPSELPKSVQHTIAEISEKLLLSGKWGTSKFPAKEDWNNNARNSFIDVSPSLILSEILKNYLTIAEMPEKSFSLDKREPT